MPPTPQTDYRPAPSYGGVLAFLSILLLIVTGLLAALIVRTYRTPHYEFMVQDVPDVGFADTMNGLGQQGWHLVSARRASEGTDSDTFNYEVIMEREAGQ